MIKAANTRIESLVACARTREGSRLLAALGASLDARLTRKFAIDEVAAAAGLDDVCCRL